MPFPVSLPKTFTLVTPTPQIEKVDQREEKSDRGQPKDHAIASEEH
jgi:hypothetical protein